MEQAIKKYLVTDGFEIKEIQLDQFVRQFSKKWKLEDIKLIKSIVGKWKKPLKLNYIEFPKRKQKKEIADKLKWKNRGVYAIFACDNPRKCKCFYIGMSNGFVKDRIKIHLRKDIEKNYGGVFKKLKKSKEVYVCYAYINTHNNNLGESKKQKLKKQLILLEHCLTTILRPWFFIGQEPT